MATQIPFAQPEIPADEVVVLAVEDSEDDFFLLRRAFQQAGIRAKLVRAKDGLEGKEYLDRSIIAGRLPACVVLDPRMPRMDGFELLAYIKARTELKSLPVTMLSTSSNPLDMARAYRLGAKTYLVKPTAFDALVQISLAIQNQWMGAKPQPANEQ
jgi:CheY-like chemotaxis protein